MARLIGEVPLAPLAISAGSTYYLWQGTAPTHQRVCVNGFFVANDYNTNGTPGLLGLYFVAAGNGGAGGSSVTPVSIDQGLTETFQSTWVTNPAAPTSPTLIREIYVNPQVAVPEYLPLHEEFVIKGGGIFVVKFQPQVAGNVSGWLRISE